MKRLNSASLTVDDSATHALAIVAAYPGWKEPPWQDVDARKHKALIYEIIKFRGRGADVYFGRKSSPFGGKEPQMREEELRLAFERGVRLQVWQTKLINWLDDRPAPSGEQTVVRLRYGRSAMDGNPKAANPGNHGVGVFIVTDDLKKLDNRVSNGHAATLGGSTVLLFDSKPHFIVVSRLAVQIKRDFGSGPSTFCELEYRR